MDPITVLQSRIEQLEAKLGIIPSTLDFNDTEQAGTLSQQVSEMAPAQYSPEQMVHKNITPHASHPPHPYQQPVTQPQPQYQAQLTKQNHSKPHHEDHMQHENHMHPQHAVQNGSHHQHPSEHLHSTGPAHKHVIPLDPMHLHASAASPMHQHAPAASPMHQHAPATSPMHYNAGPASNIQTAPHCQHGQGQHHYQNKEPEHYQHDSHNLHQHGDSVTANLMNVANTINSAVAGHEKLAGAMQQATELNNYMEPNLMENIEKSKLHVNEVIASEPILKHHCQCMHRYKQAAPAMESEAIAQVPQMQPTLDNMHAGVAKVKAEADIVGQGVQQLAETCGAAAMRGSEQLADVARQVDLLEQRNRKRNGLDDY